MDITLTILDEDVDALATRHGWSATVKNEKGEEIANPVSSSDVVLNLGQLYFQNEVEAVAAQSVEASRIQVIQDVRARYSTVKPTVATPVKSPPITLTPAVVA